MKHMQCCDNIEVHADMYIYGVQGYYIHMKLGGSGGMPPPRENSRF